MSAFTNVISALALACAMGALLTSIRANRIARDQPNFERDRDSRAEEALQRRDAELVTAWVAKDTANVPYVVVDNESRGQVLRVKVFVTGFHRHFVSEQSFVPAGQFCFRRHPTDEFPWTKGIPAESFEPRLQPDTSSKYFAVRYIDFTDLNGLRWRRHGDGSLIRRGDDKTALSRDRPFSARVKKVQH